MKKIMFVLCLFVALFIPNNAIEANTFKEDPVAVVIIDKTSSVSRNMMEQWQDRVNRRFRFPDYKMIEQEDLHRILRGKLPVPEGKRPHYRKEQLEEIAEIAEADLVFVICVEKITDRIIYRSFRLWDTDQIRQTYVSIDVSVYRKTDDKYFFKKIHDSKTNDLANSVSAMDIATQRISDVINEFKEKLPRTYEV